jgi:hypothetical protein
VVTPGKKAEMLSREEYQSFFPTVSRTCRKFGFFFWYGLGCPATLRLNHFGKNGAVVLPWPLVNLIFDKGFNYYR